MHERYPARLDIRNEPTAETLRVCVDRRWEQKSAGFSTPKMPCLRTLGYAIVANPWTRTRGPEPVNPDP